MRNMTNWAQTNAKFTDSAISKVQSGWRSSGYFSLSALMLQPSGMPVPVEPDDINMYILLSSMLHVLATIGTYICAATSGNLNREKMRADFVH